MIVFKKNYFLFFSIYTEYCLKTKQNQNMWANELKARPIDSYFKKMKEWTVCGKREVTFTFMEFDI